MKRAEELTGQDGLLSRARGVTRVIERRVNSALRLESRASTRSTHALTTSTGDNSRRRMRAATSLAATYDSSSARPMSLLSRFDLAGDARLLPTSGLPATPDLISINRTDDFIRRNARSRMTSVQPLRAAVTETPLGRPGVLSPAFIGEGAFVHVSGQGPLVGGAYVPGTVEDETARTLDNLATVLEASGSSLRHVVRCGIYLADMADFDAMNRIWSERFAEPRPARTTIQAGALPGGIKVEIDCVALLASDWREKLRRVATADAVADFATVRATE